MNPNDVFLEMLVGDEAIVGGVGAPGPRRDHRTAWIQVALTPYRVLVARMAQNPAGWVVEERLAANLDAVQVHQYPHTPGAPARLELRGFQQPVVLLEIDRPDLNPQLDPFLKAWGRPITGVQRIPVRDPASLAPQPKVLGADPDTLKMLAVVGVGIGLVGLCCGCGSLLVLLRDTLSNTF